MSSAGKVLLALEDPAEARLVSDHLTVAGLEIVTATDGISAVALVSEAKPDVVLCSRTLPKMDGLQVCRLVKRNHKLKHVTVLVVMPSPDDSALALEAGANDYLVRPLNITELMVALRSHLKDKTSIARLKDDNRELASVLEIVEMLTSTLNSVDLFYMIVHKVAEALAVDACALLRVAPSGREATVHASMNPDDADHPEVLLADLPEVARCLSAGKMVYVEDVRRDAELVAAHGDEKLAILAVPLQARHADSGRVVFRVARRSEPFTYREIKFCQIVTTVAANALENAALYESLEIAHSTLTEVSKKDPLTDVYNRRFLFERLEVEHSRAMRRGTPLTCVMLDIDHFKRVNDDLGHQVGDSVLIGFARILKDCLRGQDVVGRYGGEEFLLVLPETGADAAMRVAERIRRGIKDHRFGGLDARRLTASMGIAVLDPAAGADLSVAALVGDADRALYEAKVERDSVVLHEAALAARTAGP